jgi:hypothetical protein
LAASTTEALIFRASDFMSFVFGIEMPFFGIWMPRTLWRLPERAATIAPATPASAAPDASSGTFALRAIGATPLAPRFTESATPFDGEAAFPPAFALARDDPLEPFDLGLEDRDPRELAPDRLALDFVLVWATAGLPFSPDSQLAVASRKALGTRC